MEATVNVVSCGRDIQARACFYRYLQRPSYSQTWLICYYCSWIPEMWLLSSKVQISAGYSGCVWCKTVAQDILIVMRALLSYSNLRTWSHFMRLSQYPEHIMQEPVVLAKRRASGQVPAGELLTKHVEDLKTSRCSLLIIICQWR